MVSEENTYRYLWQEKKLKKCWTYYLTENSYSKLEFHPKLAEHYNVFFQLQSISISSLFSHSVPVPQTLTNSVTPVAKTASTGIIFLVFFKFSTFILYACIHLTFLQFDLFSILKSFERGGLNFISTKSNRVLENTLYIYIDERIRQGLVVTDIRDRPTTSRNCGHQISVSWFQNIRGY